MKFLNYLPIALLPAVMVASPAALAEPSDEEIVRGLIERDTPNLGGLIGQLTDSAGAIGKLLSPNSLNNIDEVITDAATLLKDPTTKQIKSVVGTADRLLGSDAFKDLANKLPDMLGSVTGLLTPALITNVTDILGNAHSLLTADFVGQTKGLINDVAPLVSAISQVITALLQSVLGG